MMWSPAITGFGMLESCRRACIGVQVEVGSGYGLHQHSKQPADVLAANWMVGKSAAFDFTVTSLLVSNSLPEASVTARSEAFAAEDCKHRFNDSKCMGVLPICSGDVWLLGYRSDMVIISPCISIGCKTELLKVHSHRSYKWWLNLTLIRANVRAILSRSFQDH